MKLAVALLEQKLGSTAKKSSIFITAAWGNENQPEFYNQAIEIITQLSAKEVLKTALEVEELLGRKRNNDKWQERTMDIDILFYNDEILQELKRRHKKIIIGPIGTD